MFQLNSQRIHFLFIYFAIKLTLINGSNRENLALRHPCNSINKRLEPYIKWTEKLASSQYGVVKDACSLSGAGPSCCTTDIVNSYGYSLGDDLKLLFDEKLGKLRSTIHEAKANVDQWRHHYVSETRHITVSSLEKLFSYQEYHSNIHHSVTSLFNVLVDSQSTDSDVSRAANDLFKSLVISMYRRFMSIDSEMKIDDQLEKCLLVKAFDIEAFPTQRELLYTLTSGASLVNILDNVFVYLDADIERMNKTATMEFHPCIQRYARETLCPMCLDDSISSLDETQFNETLCQNDCRYLVKTCFDAQRNPYISFVALAQSYANSIKQIQEAVVELKLVQRLTKFHIYLYDMVVNASNTMKTYTKLQKACPNENSKPFSPLLSIEAIVSERRDLVQSWNKSLHFLFEHVQSSIENLNKSLTDEVSEEICLNSKYSAGSERCTQIDQHIPGDLSQWPIGEIFSNSSDQRNELTLNQIDDLKRKLSSVQDIIVSMRPRKKYSLYELMPRFESYENDVNSNETEFQPSASYFDSEQNEEQESFSEQIYKQIEAEGTTKRQTTTKRIFLSSNGNSREECRLTKFLVSLLIFALKIVH